MDNIKCLCHSDLFIICEDMQVYFFVIKPTRCTNFTNLFCHETLHVSDSFSFHQQEFIHCTLNNGICHCRQLSSRSICSCSITVYKPVWHIPLLSVQWINSWWWTDELSETCRVSWQNKYVKLVHLVGFIIKKFVTMQHGHMNVNCKLTFGVHLSNRHVWRPPLPWRPPQSNCLVNFKNYLQVSPPCSHLIFSSAQTDVPSTITLCSAPTLMS